MAAWACCQRSTRSSWGSGPCCLHRRHHFLALSSRPQPLHGARVSEKPFHGASGCRYEMVRLWTWCPSFLAQPFGHGLGLVSVFLAFGHGGGAAGRSPDGRESPKIQIILLRAGSPRLQIIRSPLPKIRTVVFAVQGFWVSGLALGVVGCYAGDYPQMGQLHDDP